ncbi:hypothetical protein ACVCAH_36805 [Micromonospora sp. LZ34]
MTDDDDGPPRDQPSNDVMPRRRAEGAKKSVFVVVIVACVFAVAIGLLATWVRGDASGTVAGKEVVSTSACNRYGQNCRLRICYQVTYVTDGGRSKTSCVSKARFDKIRPGDRFPD